MEDTTDLAVLDDCMRAIAEADSLDQLADIRSRAEAIRIWAKSASQSLDVQNRAAEMRLRAERKAGQMLSQMKLKGGDRRSKGHDDRLKLTDLGITPNQSKRWQKEAAVSEQQFAAYVLNSKRFGEEITAAGLLRAGSRMSRSHKSKLHLLSATTAAMPVPAEERQESCTSSDGWLSEVEEHLSLLVRILRPYSVGEIEALTKGERRAVLYLVSEVQRLIPRHLDASAPQG